MFHRGRAWAFVVLLFVSSAHAEAPFRYGAELALAVGGGGVPTADFTFNSDPKLGVDVALGAILRSRFAVGARYHRQFGIDTLGRAGDGAWYTETTAMYGVFFRWSPRLPDWAGNAKRTLYLSPDIEASVDYLTYHFQGSTDDFDERYDKSAVGPSLALGIDGIARASDNVAFAFGLLARVGGLFPLSCEGGGYPLNACANANEVNVVLVWMAGVRLRILVGK